LFALLMIVYRLRNNLFHGSKQIGNLNNQAENLNMGSKVLTAIMERFNVHWFPTHRGQNGKSNQLARQRTLLSLASKAAHLIGNPPDIITNRGAVEDWTIANRTSEVHEFHMHQIHFLLLEVNGKPVAKKDRQFYDTYQVGYWDPSTNKKGYPIYPNIKVRMDFRGAVTGDFVYHCHILDHEDLGMMAIIRVLPKNSAKTPKSMSAAAAAAAAAQGINAAM
jgi:hypothetical protein